ncbi:hypothetical protein ABFS83_14G053200 [Erythranthe nasuta]
MFLGQIFVRRRKKVLQRTATQMKFPEEITYEILYNLRVKSLLRFKCVSKRWRSIISSKKFIKRHLEKSITDPDITRHRILLRFHHRCLQQNTVLLHSLRPLLYGPNATFDNLPQQTNLLTRVWGSCNGLTLLFVNNARLVLLNLMSRKLKIVPSFPKEGGEYARHDTDRFIYGLGYDESTDDYKVVCIYSLSNSKPYRTQMYSSKTDSWKKIEDFDKGIIPVDDSGKFVNGKLHWLAKDENGGRDHEIVALDLVEGKYEIMDRPGNFSNSVPYQPILGDLGGYLSLIGHGIIRDATTGNMLDTSVWVMKEYGVRESWTKIWTLSDFDDPKNRIRDAMPLCFRNNGDIAVAFGSSIVVYNGKNKLREIRGAIVNDIIESLVYVESLVSPFGDEELGH